MNNNIILNVLIVCSYQDGGRRNEAYRVVKAVLSQKHSTTRSVCQVSNNRKRNIDLLISSILCRNSSALL